MCRTKFLNSLRCFWEKPGADHNQNNTCKLLLAVLFFLYAPGCRLGIFISWQQHTPSCYLCGDACNSSLFTWQAHFLVMKYFQIQMTLKLQLLLADCCPCCSIRNNGNLLLLLEDILINTLPWFLHHEQLTGELPYLHVGFTVSQPARLQSIIAMDVLLLHPSHFFSHPFYNMAFLSDFLILPQIRFGMWCSASNIHFWNNFSAPGYLSPYWHTDICNNIHSMRKFISILLLVLLTTGGLS